MKTMIYCTNPGWGINSFFANVNGRDYYLFSQTFSKAVYNFYMNGVDLGNAIDKSKARKSAVLLNTMEKIPIFIKYVEREYGLSIFRRKTNRSGSTRIRYSEAA